MTFRGRCSIWRRWRVAAVARHIVNSVSFVARMNHDSDFSWQVQYLVTLRVAAVAPRNVNEVSCVTRLDHENHFFVAGTVFDDLGG